VNVLTPPRPAPVEDALRLAARWCAGQTVDGGPALRHACAVAVTLGTHCPGAPPELIAAALLHDAPEYAGDKLEQVGLGTGVLALIRAIDAEHRAMAAYHRDPAAAGELLDGLDRWALTASTADKVVSLGTILRRAGADDRAAYWRRRSAFLDHTPYFRLFATAAAPVVPPGLADALDRLVTTAEVAALEFPR
jgi:hypothetical protein